MGPFKVTVFVLIGGEEANIGLSKEFEFVVPPQVGHRILLSDGSTEALIEDILHYHDHQDLMTCQAWVKITEKTFLNQSFEWQENKLLSDGWEG